MRDAYLRRLGIDVEPPSADALRRLHRAHVERVPYETVWIHTGDRWDVDPSSAVNRIARGRRGGYCFHLNGALAALLSSLGYGVHRHVGGVHGPDGPSPDAMANHLVLTVDGLPSDDNPGGRWYVDAGLGDALHDPLPLVAGDYEQTPWRLVLSDDGAAGVGDWHLTHDPGGGFKGMAWRSAPTTMDAFAARNEWLSTSPESGFVKVLTVQRRDAAGVDVLRGLVVKRIGDGAFERDVESQAELFALLEDDFALDLRHLDKTARRALWDRLVRGHEAWVAVGRP